jgi:hypothetical protein
MRKPKAEGAKENAEQGEGGRMRVKQIIREEGERNLEERGK